MLHVGHFVHLDDKPGKSGTHLPTCPWGCTKTAINTMKKNILLFLIAFISFNSYSQGVPVKDSLLRKLAAAPEDTSKIMLLLKVQKLYSTDNFDSSLYYLNTARDLAQKLRTDAFDFYINTGFAEYYYYNNSFKNALDYAMKNKEIAEKGNDQKLLAKSYNNLAAVYNHFGQYQSAIDYTLKCIAISEQTKDSASFPVRNLTASNTYYNLQQFDKAIVYAKKAIEYGKQFHNSFVVMMGLNNLSASYSGLNMLDSSIMINKQQLEIAKQEEDIVNINYALINLCLDHFKIGNMAALENYAAELASYSKNYPDNSTNIDIHDAFALNFIAQQKYGQAKAELDAGIRMALEDSNLDALGNLYRNYSILNYTQGKIKEGETYSFKYDSIISAGNLKELNFYTEELETKYGTEKKEAQIKLQQAKLKQKNDLNYFLIAFAAVLLLIIFLVYRNYRNRQHLQQAKIDELETEKQLMAAAAVLKGEEQERTRLAKDLHDGLGGMLSGIKYSLSNVKENLVMNAENAEIFERSIDMLDSSIREMRRVAHNMMPEVLLRYGLDAALKEFCNEIDRSGVTHIVYQSIGMEEAVVDKTTAVTIYRVAQELVNNAIKHAAAQNLLVQLHASGRDKLLSLTVEDDGSGFDTAILKNASGMGWSNIQSRVEFLKGKIDINSTAGNGTSVLVEVSI